MNPSPAQVGPRRATERDVRLYYRVLHGREPENRRAVEIKMSVALRDLVAAGLKSDEFYSNPVAAMARGEPPVHARKSRGPGQTDLEWAAENLPLEQATRVRLTTVRSWREFFAILFNDEALRRSVPALQADPSLSAALLEAINNPEWREESAIVGAIEQCLGADIKGWAAYPMAPDEPVTLEILADGAPVGVATCNRFRGDLAQVVGADGNFGFQFTLPRSLRRLRPKGFIVTAVDLRSRQPIDGKRSVDLSRNSDLGELAEMNRRLAEIETSLKSIRAQIPSVSLLTSYSLDDYDDYVCQTAVEGEFHRTRQRADALRFQYRPVVSIVLRRFNSDPARLEESLRTVSRQTYDRWELLVCIDASVSFAETRETVDRLFRDDPRVKVLQNDGERQHLVWGNACIAAAIGEYLCFLDAGDELSDDALFSVLTALQARRYKLLYSDEDRLSMDDSGRRFLHSPYFKPDFDWDMLIGQSYASRLLVVETALVARIGGYRSQFEGVQDYDLVLRCLENIGSGDVGHIRRVIYHWRTEAQRTT